jgi:hypothetical protein
MEGMSIKKRKLSDLVREETQASPDPEMTKPEPTELETDPEPLPKYLTLVRKETRLTDLQIEQLTILTRKLNRRKKGGERITENTLIRVAVDLLLSRKDDLKGTTEAELRAALGLEVTE